MTSTTRQGHARSRRFAIVAMVVLALVAAACGSSSKSTSTSSTATPSTSGATSSPGSTASAPTVAQPGVTATTITVGTVTTLSGPVPGLFQGAVDGTQAYLAYINSMGGVDGRQLKSVTLDDALECGLNQSQFADNMNKVFAFVGSLSVFDNCGAKALAANPTVSSVAFELTPEAKALANQFDPETQPVGYRLGGFEYYKQTYPTNLKVGGLYSNASGATISWDEQLAAMKSIGYTETYSRATAATETNFTADVLRMKNDGVNFLWLTDEDIEIIANVMNEAAQQNWHPLIVSGNTAYDPNLQKLLNPGVGNGLLNDQLVSMYLGQDSATVPAVGTFLTWMKKTNPSFQPDLYSVMAWSAAALYVQALKAAGPQPTRAGLLSALENIHSFNADGLIATDDPGAHKPSECYVVLKYDNKQWTRVTPATGFRCDPGGYFYYKGS